MKKGFQGFEWKSKMEVLGFPLIHITVGRSPQTGKPLVSRGVIAIGQVGIGLITFAQVGVGLLFGLGQVMGGWFVIAQIAAGKTAICQVGVAEYLLAQVGVGTHIVTTKVVDPVAQEYFLRLWDSAQHFLMNLKKFF